MEGSSRVWEQILEVMCRHNVQNSRVHLLSSTQSTFDHPFTPRIHDLGASSFEPHSSRQLIWVSWRVVIAGLLHIQSERGGLSAYYFFLSVIFNGHARARFWFLGCTAPISSTLRNLAIYVFFNLISLGVLSGGPSRMYSEYRWYQTATSGHRSLLLARPAFFMLESTISMWSL